jgi:hypothetical protein
MGEKRATQPVTSTTNGDQIHPSLLRPLTIERESLFGGFLVMDKKYPPHGGLGCISMESRFLNSHTHKVVRAMPSVGVPAAQVPHI